MNWWGDWFGVVSRPVPTPSTLGVGVALAPSSSIEATLTGDSHVTVEVAHCKVCGCQCISDRGG